MIMKQGVRILAINDSPFKLTDREALVVGIVGRQGIIEGVLSFNVSVDGKDSTEKIMRAIRRSRFADQIKVTALNGTVIAGLNVIDLPTIRKSLGIEPLAITRKKPHPHLLERVARTRSGKERSDAIKRLNSSLKITRINGYYVQHLNESEKPTAEMVESCVYLLRLAHLVASGVVRGESKGRL